MTLVPIEFPLPGGQVIAGVTEAEEAPSFTIIFLHEPGGDLDALLPVMRSVGIAEARKVAVDLPGHGLSTGYFELGQVSDALDKLRGVMRERGWGPFLYVAAGSTAMAGLDLARAHDSVGLCLVSPRSGEHAIGGDAPRCPVLAFIASRDEAASRDWSAIRSSLQSWWLGVSVAVDHQVLVTADASVSGQIASHLQGFARDMYLTRRPAETVG
jgi:pimeloyl-ACP methyl ester carboxylesterase